MKRNLQMKAKSSKYVAIYLTYLGAKESVRTRHTLSIVNQGEGEDEVKPTGYSIFNEGMNSTGYPYAIERAALLDEATGFNKNDRQVSVELVNAYKR